MAAPSSLTLNYDAVLSTTLFNYHKTLEDEISTANAFLFFLMRKSKDSYETLEDIGDRMQIPLMYALTPADSYSGYDVLDVSPVDGITSAFYDWRQMAVPITISGLEEKKNNSEAKILDLLEAKTKQAVLGMQDLFGRTLLQGNGPNVATQVALPYVSPANGSTFMDPILKQIANAPSTGVVGNIDPATQAWWRNKNYDAQNGTGSGSPTPAVTTFAGFLKALRHLRNEASKGPGGPPNLCVVTQGTYELYEAALAAAHRNPSYQVADIPFDTIAFFGQPVTWDEFTSDALNGTVAITKGTWIMVNTKFWGLQVHSSTNFAPTPFEKPINQDAKTAHVLWLGGLGLSNRRKQAVMSGIDETIAA